MKNIGAGRRLVPPTYSYFRSKKQASIVLSVMLPSATYVSTHMVPWYRHLACDM
jgi:hypothetical protein